MKTLKQILKNKDEEIIFHKQVLDKKNYNTVFNEINSIVSQHNDKKFHSTSFLNQSQNNWNKNT